MFIKESKNIYKTISHVEFDHLRTALWCSTSINTNDKAFVNPKT
jgi:hypothetical protein